MMPMWDQILDEDEWLSIEHAHHERIDAWMSPHLKRRSRHELDPVTDFLFEYYEFRPAQLRRWSPGTGVLLKGEKADKFLSKPEFERFEGGVGLHSSRFPQKKRSSTRWILSVLECTQSNPPLYGCFGLHEWAMLYQTTAPRHTSIPLRLSHREIDEIVDAHTLRCTHYDAFRFFSGESVQANRYTLTPGDMCVREQPGCLHANMDIYRWAFKRYPWIGSNLIADSFFLATRIREIDMRASPYDLGSNYPPPIRIESPAGKQTYRHFQETFHKTACELRSRLIEAYRRLPIV